jgi:hypothetical protein
VSLSLLDQPVDWGPADLIDLDRYPILDPESPRGAKLIGDIRARMAETVLCALPGFLKASVVPRLAAETEALVPLAYRGPHEASPYFFSYGTDLSSLPPDHPRRRKSPRRLSQVAYDLVPETALIRRLYEWQPLADFLARALGVPALYRGADRFQALNLSVMEEDGCQQWHFDTNESNITLLVQAAEAGGEFEYVPLIRSEEDENYDEVKRVLDGDSRRVVRLAQDPGMLVLFRGRRSLHRVAPCRGKRRRLQSVLAFNSRPGVVGSHASNLLHYGPRVALYPRPQAESRAAE